MRVKFVSQDSNKPHCINQSTPEMMFKAFKYLDKRVSQNSKEPLFFS